MVKKWLITGGCGFIGRNLTGRLLAKGDCYIRIVDNLSVGTKADLEQVTSFTVTSSKKDRYPVLPDQQVELVIGDILDEELAVRLADGMDVIVHLAANTGVAPSVENPRADCVSNVLGTLNFLEAARLKEVSRFIFASSGAPAGECEPPIHEELPPHPVSPYGASKLAGEGYCSAYFRTFGIDTVALRFSNVYGPLSSKKDSVVAKFIKKILDGQGMEVYGDGNQTRDFIYIDDLVEAILLAATRSDIGGETFQIATGRETSVGEIAEKLADLFQKSGMKNVPGVQYSSPRLGDVKRNFSDTSKAQERLHWSPQVTLDRGLEQTIDWFMSKKDNMSFPATP